MYYNELTRSYCGKEYTYKTELPLKLFQKVLVPVSGGGKKKALVVDIDLPESVVDPAWADKLKEITEIYYEENAE